MATRDPVAWVQEYLRETAGWWDDHYFVYALLDPRDLQVRYIGSTSDPKQRLESHLSQPLNDEMRAWFDELRSIGLLPRLMTLADAYGPQPALKLENIYIFEYAANGAQLFNKQNPLLGQIRGWWEMWGREWRSNLRRQSYVEVKPTLPKRRGHNAGKTFPLEGVVIEAHGKRQNIAAWARELGLSRQRIHQRLKKYPPEIALAPKQKNTATLVA